MFDENSLLFISAGLGVAFIILLIILLAFLVFHYVGLWKMYQKAGKKGWEAIIPIYSTFVLTDIAGLNVYWFVILIISSVLGQSESFLSTFAYIGSTLANIAIAYNLKEKFCKNNTWFILSIFFGGITIPLLGYSDNDKYNADAVVSPDAMFGKK